MPNPKPNNTGLKTNLRTIKRSNDGDLGIEGKIIPQAVPVEEVVLGAITIYWSSMPHRTEESTTSARYRMRRRYSR